MQHATTLTDNRAIDDRREFGWRTVLYGFVRSRRRSPRRLTEAEPVYTDWHHPWLFFLAISTMLLSAADAFLTLHLITLGAVEINPVMAAMMGHSIVTFAISKMLLSATGILALVFLSRAPFLKRFRTGLFLTFLFSLYACLVCYEFVLLVTLI